MRKNRNRLNWDRTGVSHKTDSTRPQSDARAGCHFERHNVLTNPEYRLRRPLEEGLGRALDVLDAIPTARQGAVTSSMFENT